MKKKQTKQLLNMKVIGVTIVFSARGTVSMGLKKRQVELKIRRIKTIQTIGLWLARILRRVLDTRDDILSPRLKWKDQQLDRVKIS